MLGKGAAPPVSLSQRQRQDVFYCPVGYQSEFTLFHTSRVIKYVFLDGSQNIAPSSHPSPLRCDSHWGYLKSAKDYYYYPLVFPDHRLANSYWSQELERLPIFVTLSKAQEKRTGRWGRPLYSWDRLPVFRQLCGEAIVAAPHRRDDAPQRKEDKPKTTKVEPEKAEDLQVQEKEPEKDKKELEEKKEEKKEEEEDDEAEADSREKDTTP